ncbi:MAG: response regulator transcription factor [Verrucomicrobiota bacterium JB022]|nr:response regulator transcription factor [Verrucomicrobiota bacterium JB022]
MNTSISVAIVEDNPEICDELQNIIRREPDLDCLVCCRNVASATAILPTLQPDVVLMDVQLPDGTGIEIVRQVKPRMPETQVVMLTISQDIDIILSALGAGATGYLLKNSSDDEIVNAVRNARLGDSPLSGRVARCMVNDLQRQYHTAPAQPKLTSREQEVLESVALGHSDKQIAAQLKITLQTVNSHLKNIYTKLEVHSRSQAIAHYFMGKQGEERSLHPPHQAKPARRTWFTRAARV